MRCEILYKELRKEARDYFDKNYGYKEPEDSWLYDGVYIGLCKFLGEKVRMKESSTKC
jgi:hypothetical protein